MSKKKLPAVQLDDDGRYYIQLTEGCRFVFWMERRNVYTKTDRRRGQVKGAKRATTTRAKRGPKPFEPTPQERHIIGF